MPSKPCITTGCPHLASNGPRCTHCQRAADQQRNARRSHLHGDWTATSRKVRDAWVEANGWVCPGYQRDPHPSRDLTTDHVTAGTRDDGLSVLCRSCNASKGSYPHHPHEG